jgi:hypothetical protein
MRETNSLNKTPKASDLKGLQGSYGSYIGGIQSRITARDKDAAAALAQATADGLSSPSLSLSSLDMDELVDVATSNDRHLRRFLDINSYFDWR